MTETKLKRLFFVTEIHLVDINTPAKEFRKGKIASGKCIKHLRA